jgi:exoribonuclease-2
MHVFFEDDGAFKAGTVLVDNDTSLQVETSSGKRIKVKAANVLLRYEQPSPAALLAEAQTIAQTLDPGFLWEASADGEFSFADLAREYFGRTPQPPEAAALALCLHASPMHFYKKGKGRYRAAPDEALAAALAGVERKRREAQQIAHDVELLKQHRLPDSFRDKLPMLLHRPDKQALESRAIAAACGELHTSPLALLAACGAIPSTHEFHFDAFVQQAFPRGLAFPSLPELASSDAQAALPLAAAEAFSIDDATTTEIDDAFSVRALGDGNSEIGIHIAAPALLVAKGTALDACARARLSTVYMPGRKITMLPENVIERFSLAQGAVHPVLSLYVQTSADGTPLSRRTCLERIAVVANLRPDDIEASAGGVLGQGSAWGDALAALQRLARQLEAARGKPDTPRIDFNFYVDWDAAPDGVVRIVPRPRGSALDKLVAELMIHVNAQWGADLAAAGVPGMYRTQQQGKVRMSVRPEPHQGLGVAQYLWASSPLRRYSDLVNQRQLLALVSGTDPPYAAGDAELFAAMNDFELTYAQYAEFQARMEHYWCLRWLLQERIERASAVVLRDNLVRLEAIPLYLRVPDLPALAGESRVTIAPARVDLLAATVETRYLGPADA